jgi:putative ABC transport system permease protein
MRPLGLLAVRNLARSPVRTALVLLGLAVTGALLLDMTMLSRGLEASLGAVLSRLGFAIRVVPRGTLPFSSDAEIPDGDRLAAAIAARPGVAASVPVVATNLYVRAGGRKFAAFALGVPAGGTGAYAVLRGRDLPLAAASGPGDAPSAADPDFAPPVVINRNMARLDRVRIGDMLTLSAVPEPFVVRYAAPRTFRVVGIADFYFDLATQRSVALATPDLRGLQGRPVGPASLILVRMSDPAQTGALVRWIQARAPRVDALSIRGFLDRASTELTYFRQFSLILGTISLAVSFLLITAIVTLSLGERLGEIAVLRAIGFTRGRIGVLVLLEGLLLSAVSLPGAFGLGLVISHNLDGILRSAPSVPENVHFFTLTTSAALRTVLLVLATGTVGGVYPAVVASRLGVAATLHGEVLS